MAFTDNFDGEASDVDLADHTPSGGTAWTRTGTADSIIVYTIDDGCRPNNNTTAYYICDDQGSADHYTQAVLKNTGSNDTRSAFVCCRLVDTDNLVGWFQRGGGSAGIRLAKIVSGTQTELITHQPVENNTYKIECSGTDVSFYDNGTQVGTTQTVTDHQTETSQGVASLGDVSDPWIDDFEAGALSGGGTTEEASVSFGATADTGYTAIATAEGNTSFPASVDAVKSATATALGSIAFPVSGGFSTTGQASREASTTADVTVGDSVSADAQAEGSTAYAVTAADTVTGESIGEAEATMSVDVQVSDQYVAQAIANAATSQGVSAGKTFAAQIEAETSVTYGATADYSTTGQAVTGGTFESAVTVSQDVTVTAAAEATAEASIIVTQELAASVIAEAAAAAGINVGSVSDVSFTGTTVSGSVMTPDGRTLTISARIKTLTISAESRTLTIN